MHALAYDWVTRGELVACCDIEAECREAFAGQFGIAGYADAAEMVRAEQPDLVQIVTPPTARVGLMRLMNELGVPGCIVEKPIAREVADWRELVALEAEAETKYAVNHQFRWHANLTHCREALQSGKLGQVRFLDTTAGMTISGQGTHMLDYAMSLNDDAPVVRVFGAASGAEAMTGYHPGPDTTVGQLLFANGVYGIWSNGYTAPPVGDPDLVHVHFRVAAYAERGHVLWEGQRNWEIVSPEGREGGFQGAGDLWMPSNHAAQAALCDAMFDWIEDYDKPAGTNLALGLHQWQVVLGLYASALWRKPVEIPFDPPDDLFDQLAEALA